MNRDVLSFLFILALLTLATSARATVIYVSGDQTGTWSADTVIVTAEVRVPPGQSLTILPGVEVLFQVHCKLIVDSAATLYAVGTLTDSIRFDVLLPDSGWHGIRFLSASDSSRLEYCRLANGSATGDDEDRNGGAIYCSSSSPTVSHNSINENSAVGSGGAIYCGYNSSPTISGNTIIGNSAWGGGGISCVYNSNPNISGNTINGNSVPWQGGAIHCGSNSNPTISGNTISGNSSGSNGGGIVCWSSSPTIIGNTIRHNSANAGGGIKCDDSSIPAISGNIIIENDAYWSGGGISCSNSSPSISGNIISGNSVDVMYGGGIECYHSSSSISSSISGNTIIGNSAWQGGGIFCWDNSNLTINGNTISGNSASDCGGIRCHLSSSATLVNCIVWGNSPPQVVQTSGSHLQATYCDIQDILWPGEGNIMVAPLFVDPVNGDYHLQSTVGSFHGGSWLPDPLHSHCIDAGDPSSPFALEPMPNGGRVNMGFEGNTWEASLSVSTSAPPPSAGLPREFRLCPPYPNPFNPITEISYTLPQAGPVSLRVYDILGRRVAVLVDGFSTPGTYRTTFDGSQLSSGIYLARLQAGTYSQTRKLVLLK